jgi:mRNA interferase MazF
VVTRGAVYWIDLDKRRPCVVVSSDDVLSVDVWLPHVVPITSDVGRAGIAGNVLLPAKASGLPKDSVAVPLGLELIDRSLLGKPAGRLPEVLIDDIDEDLRAVRGICHVEPELVIRSFPRTNPRTSSFRSTAKAALHRRRPAPSP